MSKPNPYLRFTLAVIVAALALAGCRRNNESRDAAPTTGPADFRAHWIQDERLRGVMAELSRQSANWPAGVPDDPESAAPDEQTRSAFQDAERLADGLARAARDIPRAVAGREMSPEMRRGFTAEARRLREQALQLKAAARARRVEPMQRALDGISASCISCHSQYRDFSGELDPRRASLR